MKFQSIKTSELKKQIKQILDLINSHWDYGY